MGIWKVSGWIICIWIWCLPVELVKLEDPLSGLPFAYMSGTLELRGLDISVFMEFPPPRGPLQMFWALLQLKETSWHFNLLHGYFLCLSANEKHFLFSMLSKASVSLNFPPVHNWSDHQLSEHSFSVSPIFPWRTFQFPLTVLLRQHTPSSQQVPYEQLIKSYPEM